jgi:hypothetical protein
MSRVYLTRPNTLINTSWYDVRPHVRDMWTPLSKAFLRAFEVCVLVKSGYLERPEAKKCFVTVWSTPELSTAGTRVRDRCGTPL